MTPVPAVTPAQLTQYNTQVTPTVVATISATAVLAPTLAAPTTNPIFFNGRSAVTPDDISKTTTFGPGTTGTMHDISIFDDVAGLDHGTYFLRIYIDNLVQPLGSMNLSRRTLKLTGE